MSADFNAGSIEGTLSLDTAPFAEGLRRAKAEAADFARQKITAKVDVDATQATTKTDNAARRVDEFGRKRATATLDVNTSSAEAKLTRLSMLLGKSLDAGGAGRGLTGGLFSVSRITAMVGGAMSLAAALGPATAAVVGFGGAASVAFAGAGASLALFAKVVSSDMRTIQDAIKKGVQLSGPAGVAETALKHLTSAWNGFQKATSGATYGFLTTAFTGLAGVLPKLIPLINTVGHGLSDVLQHVFALARTSLFTQFLSSLQGFMHGFLAGAGPVIANLLATFMHLFIALRPLMAELGNGLLKASAAANDFAAGGGLTKFVKMVQADIPPVLRLVKDLIHTLGNIGAGLAPLSGPALRFIDGLVRAIGKINLAPLASGFGSVLGALQPVLPVLAQLVNVLLTPLGHLLSSLAKGPIGALVHSLGSELQPAFHSLSQILNALVKPLSNFIGSIANLANPTGVSLVASLLHLLVKPVQILAPAFSNLMVALESVIDNGISAILPLLPKLAPLLNTVAKGVAAFADGLASVLSHKSVSLTLLAIYGAFKSLTIISTVVGSIRTFIGVMRTFMEIQKAEGIMAAISALAPGMAAGFDLIGTAIDFMMGPWGLLILGLVALGVGLVEAYKHSKTFRDIVQGALHGVVAAGKAVGEWFSGPFVNFFKDVAHWFSGPFVNFFKDIGHWFSGPFVDFFKNIGQWFSGPFVNFFKNTWQAIQNGWHALGDALRTAYNNTIKPVFDTFKTVLGGLHTAFNNAVSGIKAAWSRLSSVAEAPVKFVVNTVIDNGIIGTLDKVAGVFGFTNPLHKITLPFAQGSWVPGHAATDTADNVNARLTPGEFVVKRKSAQAIERRHPGALDHINERGDLPGFAGGGPVGWLTGAAKAVGHAVSSAASFGKDLLSKANPVNFIKDHLTGLLGGIGGGVMGDVAKGAGSKIVSGIVDWVKGKVGSVFGGGAGGAKMPTGSFGSGVTQWAPDVLHALAMLGQPASLLPAVLHRMNQESGGNPNAINNWDSNAAAGDPSRGLMQTIGSTFAAYAGPFAGLGIYNPLANIYAGLNYALHAYGNIAGPMMQPGGYANGTASATPGWHVVGERGPELLHFKGGERVVPNSALGGDNAVLLLLQQIAAHLKAQGDTSALTQALGSALDKHSEAIVRQTLQAARAA